MKIKAFFKNCFSMCKSDVYYSLLFICFLCPVCLIIFDGDFIDFYNYEYTSEFVILMWLIFVFACMSFLKVFRENRKSNALLVFGILAVLYNPILKIPFYDYQWKPIVFVTYLILVHYFVIFYFKEQCNKKCSVCNSNPLFYKLLRLRIFKGGFSKGDVHFDGETYICQKCYRECEICKNCGLPIASEKIQNSLGDWETLDFCHCDRRIK